MEQLASTLRQTADTATRVAMQSEQSSTVVSRGGEAVRAVGDTMNGIEQSSRKVSEIIHVIEGIAHRTNMLALNAAVEAARAGDQGLGFAVVASEVRALAQRTAEAASEVSSLIRESTQQVAAGSTQMHGASATIHEVVSSVGQVSTLVLKITEAAQEQSMGIAQVNEAVSQLDSVTQKNAQLVDISAANARALAERAHSLNQTIDVFRLQGG
jgi:aerotaxis receptor